MSKKRIPVLTITLVSLSVAGCANTSSVLNTTPIAENKPAVKQKRTPVKKKRPVKRVKKVARTTSKVDYRRYAHLDFKKHFDYSKKINTRLASYNCGQLRQEASHTDGVVRAMKPMMGNIRLELTLNQQKAMNVAFFYTGLNKKITTEFKKRCNS